MTYEFLAAIGVSTEGLSGSGTWDKREANHIALRSRKRLSFIIQHSPIILRPFVLVSYDPAEQKYAGHEERDVAHPKGNGGQFAGSGKVFTDHQQRIIDCQDRQEADEKVRQHVGMPPQHGHRRPMSTKHRQVNPLESRR